MRARTLAALNVRGDAWSNMVRVLIVDDQASFRMAARNVLEVTEGFELVGEAASGEDAVDAARSLRPDLVLMDLRLPGIDGFEAARRIHRLHSDGCAPVILLVSTEDSPEPVDAIAECGAAAYVAKSEFGSERLIQAWAAGQAVAPDRGRQDFHGEGVLGYGRGPL